MVLSLTLLSPVSSSSLIQIQKLRYHPLGWRRYSYTPGSAFLMSEHKFKQRKARTYFSCFPQVFFFQCTSSSSSLIDCHHLTCLQICNIWLTQCGISLDLQKRLWQHAKSLCQVIQNTVSASINPTKDSNSRFTAFLLQNHLPPTITSLFEHEMAFLGDTEHSISGSWSITISVP